MIENLTESTLYYGSATVVSFHDTDLRRTVGDRVSGVTKFSQPCLSYQDQSNLYIHMDLVRTGSGMKD